MSATKVFTGLTFALLTTAASAQNAPDAPAPTAQDTKTACEQLAKSFDNLRGVSKTGKLDRVSCTPLVENGKTVGHEAVYTFGESFAGTRPVQLSLGIACTRAIRNFHDKFGEDAASCDAVMDPQNEEKQKATRTVFRFAPTP
jgi:hypothetical protein